MAYDERLAARTRAAVGKGVGISEREMFGGVCFMLHGNMFVGIVKDEIMVRVGKDAHDHAVAQPHARIMDFTGRPMRGYVFVASKGLAKDAEISAWVERGRTHAATLPKKVAAHGSKRSSAKAGGARKSPVRGKRR